MGQSNSVPSINMSSANSMNIPSPTDMVDYWHAHAY